MLDVANVFLRWTFMRSVCHRGYVLVSSLYFVVEARLSASELVVVGTVMSVTLMLSDIPIGVWSDASSRKWTLVIGHVFLAAGMVMTGLVTAFPLILATHVLWGLGWGFMSGADVAWVTDELGQPDRIARVLTASARWDLLGGATGLVAFGLLGWATDLATAIMVSGGSMALLGLFVALRFAEENFTPVRQRRWDAGWRILRQGAVLVRGDRQILFVLVATTIINGASMVSWLFPKQLTDRGFPNDPLLWLTGLGILASALGAIALRIIESRIDGLGVERRVYALACFIGVVGLIVLVFAPNALFGSIGVLIASGIAFNVTRAVSVVWVNRRTTSDVRTTMHSFLSQAESVGEIVSGFALAALANAGGISLTLIVSGVLVALAGAIVTRSGDDRVPAARAAM